MLKRILARACSSAPSSTLVFLIVFPAACHFDSESADLVSHRSTAITSANGLAFNSLGPNGLQLNGLQLNGLQLNGQRLNGLQLNGLQLNGLQLNGQKLNGLFLNGLQLNGLQLNGLQLNGLQLNGLQLNGLQLNGLQLNGLQLNSLPPSQITSAKALLDLLAECALPSGQCAVMQDLDGSPLSYCGVVGLDAGWNTGMADPEKSAQLTQCVLDRGQAAGYTMLHQPVMLESFKKILTYLTQCALPGGRSMTFMDENDQPVVVQGALGLAPEWETGPLSLTGQKRVSGCLAARVNALGKSVRLSLRTVGMPPTSAMERWGYDYHEGGFWGNLFGAIPYMRTCGVKGGGVAGRLCTQQDGCGFQAEGLCATVCNTQDGIDRYYSQCQGGSELEPEPDVINTFLPIERESPATASDSHSCFVDGVGKLWCWGGNAKGQLGDDTTTNRITPVEVPVANVVSVKSGAAFTCLLKSDGPLYCWGENAKGQLGIGSTTNQRKPVQLPITDVVSIEVGNQHACALKTNGAVYCWGENSKGQLGDGSTTNRSAPVQAAIADVVGLTSGHHFTCALKADGAVYCWGENTKGQLGNGTTTNYSTPVLTAMIDAVRLVAGEAHTCALKADGSLWCWGDNAKVQLGDGTSTKRLKPARSAVELGYGIAKVAAGKSHTCALKADGSLWCWGENASGQLGIGTSSGMFNRPQRVTAMGYKTQRMTLGAKHSLAQDIDGRWWAWGDNSARQLGTGSTAGMDGTPKRMTVHSCGDNVPNTSQESASSCGFDFCQSCTVSPATHGQTACGVCGETFAMAKKIGAICDGKATTLITDCEICGVVGSPAVCAQCEACIIGNTCQSCTISHCGFCGPR